MIIVRATDNEKQIEFLTVVKAGQEEIEAPVLLTNYSVEGRVRQGIWLVTISIRG